MGLRFLASFILMGMCLFPLVSLGFNGSTDTGVVTVRIDGGVPGSGTLHVAMHNGPETYLRAGVEPFRWARVSVDAQVTPIVFEDVPSGSYAISVFYDVNDNGSFDKGFFGSPKEPYGFSNNARGLLGPPKFRDAEFGVPGRDVELELLVY